MQREASQAGNPWEVIRAGLRPGTGYPEYIWGHNAFLRSQEKTGSFISPLHLEPQSFPQPPLRRQGLLLLHATPSSSLWLQS